MERSDQEKHAELADEFEHIYGEDLFLGVRDENGITVAELGISTNDLSIWWLMESIEPQDGLERSPIQRKYFGVR